jgi:hypothetical protein
MLLQQQQQTNDLPLFMAQIYIENHSLNFLLLCVDILHVRCALQAKHAIQKSRNFR